MPTSWWAQEIRDSYFPVPIYETVGVVDNVPAAKDLMPSGRAPTEWWRQATPSLWDRLAQWIDFSSSAGYVAVDPSTPLVDGDLAALPVLLALLQSEYAKVRHVAVSGLAVLGQRRPEVIPLLQASLHDADEHVRQEAAKGLKKVAPGVADQAGIR
jgi:hypothetical protein